MGKDGAREPVPAIRVLRINNHTLSWMSLTGGRSGMARLGRYDLIREVGAGGMSTVYEARDTVIGRRVALKVLTAPPYLPQTQRETLITRLQREARSAGRLNHPNIVTLHDVGEDAGHHYIAMEFL